MLQRFMLQPVLTLALACAVCACSNPCRDYCQTFIDRAQECGLGGPTGETAVEQCADEVSDVFEDDTCEDVGEEVERMSCATFTATVCSTPGADSTYNCP
jgi:hypothetical protein